jgi:norsolorinic acid ketoreductase
MGNAGAKALGMEQAPVAVEESCTKMVQLVDVVTKESHGGKMWEHDGEKMSW